MGLVSAVTPLTVPPQIMVFDLWFMLGVTTVFLSFVLFRKGLSRPVGMLFLAAFVGYTALQYYGVEKVFG